jgi:hypothetical protein
VEGQYVSGSGGLVGGIMLIAPDPGSISPGFEYGEWQRDDPRVEFNTQNSNFFTYFENDLWTVNIIEAEDYEYQEKVFIEAELVSCRPDLPVPTLGQWGVMALSLILGGTAFVRLRRKRRG